MRRSAVFHILLLGQCWTWAHSEADNGAVQTLDQGLQAAIQDVKINQVESTKQTNGNEDLWAELKELRDVTIELKTDLKHYLSRIERLELEKLVLELRISSTEKEMEEIKRENAELVNMLNLTKSEVEDLKRKNMLLEARMSANEEEVEEISGEHEDQPKVAFSTALTGGRFGPFDNDVTLKFSKVFVNFGQGYNPSTGFFTAPVKGIYYFRFSLLENRKDMSLGVHLFHNGEHIMGAFEVCDGAHESTSNAIILQLEQGDEIYMNLLHDHGLYDDGNNYTTFSGFLLFPL